MCNAQLADLLALGSAMFDARSLLNLAATSRRLYPLGHHAQLWAHSFRRDFPELEAENVNRQLYMAAAEGSFGAVPPGVVWLVDELLSREWGDATLRYGGWGSAHLQVRTLRRGASWIVVRAEFEYGFDDGDAVWGGRVAEELDVFVDRAKQEWSSPRARHGAWPGLQGLQEEFGSASAAIVAPCKEVELATLNPVCDAV